jgi:hypothetical protein
MVCRLLQKWAVGPLIIVGKMCHKIPLFPGGEMGMYYKFFTTIINTLQALIDYNSIISKY